MGRLFYFQCTKDGRGIGRGDHFLFYKFIERTFEHWANSTKQLLIASRGHQVSRKAAHCLRKEAGQNMKDTSNVARFPHQLNSPSYAVPWWLTCQCKRHGLDPWVGKIPWRREWQPTPVFLPEKSHGQGNLVGYSQRGCQRRWTRLSN